LGEDWNGAASIQLIGRGYELHPLQRHIPAEQTERQPNPVEFCLYDQPFIKDNSVTISQLIIGYAAKLGENVNVTRFARFSFGDPDVTFAYSNGHDEQPLGGDLSGITARIPRPPKAGSGSAAAKLETEDF
jgi:hypothetical protein